MKFFVDSADVKSIQAISEMGLVDGVTTNPSIIAKEGKDFEETIKKICEITDGPVSAEVVGTKSEEMIEEAKKLAEWSSNVVVKIPMTKEGLKAVSVLSKIGIKTNVTLIFNITQALSAIKAGATFISPFIGRLEDIGTNGFDLIEACRIMIDMYGYETEIIGASVRSMKHVEELALIGCDIATIPPSLFDSMLKHPLTDKGIEQFEKDWAQFTK
ncbi:fructose-6-phosphate aldolase [Vagococcus carniphilus]|uniref:Probable transaldolase n=1 Tax=Vagococcus carniphilus TaxID=218144 RepID=A0A430ANV4_9ENTE|nr:fructose-6-phosphate aldolase [Vagococcus carniphilus]QNN72598.1 fructose-6-phosphate aldolase [Vagococcus carniphilus]RSU09736.1 fructose-6-phosphate aldolase [Vagococcus carniphilus]